jgi:hypothetical protein
LKSIFNSTLIRTYVRIVRDNKKNKKWKSEMRVIARKSCYQLILDKKAIEDILNLDFNSKLNNSSYHFIDSYESRIAERHIWFIQSMIISNDRKRTAALCARNHYEWKKNATHIYAAQCKKYVENRFQWEWKLIKVVINSSELKWSSVTFANRILRLTNSERIHLSEDLRQMIEEEDNVKWVFLALFFCRELLFETKSIRSRGTWHVRCHKTRNLGIIQRRTAPVLRKDKALIVY